MFFVMTCGDKFIKIKGLDITLIKKIDNAAYWVSRKAAKTWLAAAKRKLKKNNIKIQEAKLSLK